LGKHLSSEKRKWVEIAKKEDAHIGKKKGKSLWNGWGRRDRRGRGCDSCKRVPSISGWTLNRKVKLRSNEESWSELTRRGEDKQDEERYSQKKL